jgi:hypothetical protein
MWRGYLVCCWYSLLAVMQVLCVNFILTFSVLIWGFNIFVVSTYISRFSVFSKLNFMLVEVFLLLDHMLVGCDCSWYCCLLTQIVTSKVSVLYSTKTSETSLIRSKRVNSTEYYNLFQDRQDKSFWFIISSIVVDASRRKYTLKPTYICDDNIKTKSKEFKLSHSRCVCTNWIKVIRHATLFTMGSN